MGRAGREQGHEEDRRRVKAEDVEEVGVIGTCTAAAMGVSHLRT